MDQELLTKLFDMHIKECDGRDQRNTKSIEEIKGMFKGIWDAQDQMRDDNTRENNEMRRDITNLQVRFALALGGLIVIGKLIDYLLPMVHR